MPEHRDRAVTAPLLDAKQAGELLNVPASWVLAEARANRIPHVRLGRYVRFDAEALEEWWQARVQGPVQHRYPRSDPQKCGGATAIAPRVAQEAKTP